MPVGARRVLVSGRSGTGFSLTAPGDVDGLYAHWVADDSGYDDAEAVTTVPDQSGNSRDLTVTAGTVTYVANQVGGKGVIRHASGGKSSKTSFFNADLVASGCVLGVWKFNGAGGEPMWDGTATYWFHSTVVSPRQGFTIQNHGTVNNYGPDGHHFFHKYWSSSGNVTYAADTYMQGMGLNFQDVTEITGFGVGVDGRLLELPRSGALEYAELCFYSRQPTWTELFNLNRYFADKYGIQSIDDLTGAVILVGNSTTRPLSVHLSPYLESRDVAIFNLARDSGNRDTINSRNTEMLEIINDFRDRGKKVVVVVHTGHNDNYGGVNGTVVINHFTGADASTTFADIKATGAKILFITPTAWNRTSSLALVNGYTDINVWRASLRTWMNASAVSGGYADDVYDLGDTAEFGKYTADAVPPAGTSIGDYPTYWADNVHQTAAGEAKKAELISTSLLALYDAA